jgi:hypothetical protein
MDINGKFRFKVEVERENFMRHLGKGEQYMRDIIADEEWACKWLNGKEIKRVFVSSNGKVASLTIGSVSWAPKGSPT